MEENKDAYNKIAKEYAKYEWNHLETLEKTAKPLIQFLRKNSKLLIVGCSSGKESDFFISNELNVISIDFSAKLIQEAKKRVKGDFRVLDLFNLEETFNKNNFDAIFCPSALQHLPLNKFEMAIKIFFNLLKKEGLLLVSFKEGPEGKEYKTQDFGVNRFYYLHSKQETERIFKKNLFRLIKRDTNKPLEDYKPLWLVYILKK